MSAYALEMKTDKAEFYSTVDLSDGRLDDLLAEWQHYYNWQRPHSAHYGKTPMDRLSELMDKTPYTEEVQAEYEPALERIQHPIYKVDLELRKLKRCL